MDILQFFEKHLHLWEKDACNLGSNEFETEIYAGSGQTGGGLTIFIYGFMDKKKLTPIEHMKRLLNANKKSSRAIENFTGTVNEVEPERIWIPRPPMQINDNPLTYAFNIYIDYKPEGI
jgi:hypothetical protein